MFEWLINSIQRAESIFQELSLDWEFNLNQPADESLLLECEAELGLSLPTSYRNFLLKFNGANLFYVKNGENCCSHPWRSDSGIVIQGTSTLLQFRQAKLTSYISEQEWLGLIPFCYLGRIGTGDFCTLDAYQVKDSEYAVLDCDHDLNPVDWRNSPIAASFEEWLKRIFAQVLEQKIPEYWYVSDYTFADSLSTEVPDSLTRLGLKASNSGEYEKAIAYFNKILEHDFKYHAAAYYDRGMIKSILEDYQAAIDDYSRAIDCEAQYGRAYEQRGLMRFKLGDYQGAIEDYNQAIEINPYIGKLYSHRGEARLRLGDAQGAAEDHQKAQFLPEQIEEVLLNNDIEEVLIIGYIDDDNESVITLIDGNEL